ncbi:transcription initiation factor TFIID subunit 5 isoform X4 [Canna indica]|uniref:Transcription initiation factor TFIID subunit 5 isoform X4 n=1 Tax=Canna indica TaxID=4628 RepID=A0AAQ3JMW1_9LILI|nr:transcription initiation factor TFIID subunit 5 isoform X4 [Canna indica]
MEEEEVQKAVIAYLRKKGFSLTDLSLQEEQNRVSASSGSDLPVSRLENDPARYCDSYSKLRSWAYSLLDAYKHELLRVLYPVFVHCFIDIMEGGLVHEARNFFRTFREDHEIMHLRDLQKLEGINSPLQLEEIELARSLRQNKFRIKMCEYSYELLLQYLQKTQSFTMLGVINEHINFEVSTGQPTSASDNVDFVTIEGRNGARQINQNEVHWGLLEDSEHLDRALSDSEKAESENKEVNPEENKKRSLDGAKQSISIKKAKKDKIVGAVGKNGRSETSAASVAPRMKPELTLPVMPLEVEQAILDDLRNRVQLNSLALPSINFYTVVNTHNSLNCLTISQNGSLVAGGFSDSSLKVWDMSKIGQTEKTSCLLEENESSKNENLPATERKRSYTLFHGHRGPIYSATFSPLGDFLLSSSSDSTIRLWSTKLNANLVCYKGHNYPVWDVQFSPAGHYFASSSHDRTARIWSMERTQPLRIMAGHFSDVDCVQWHANCNYIATGSSDKTVRLWDVQSGECARIFIGHRSMIVSLAMSPDGRYMASGDVDGTIMMWDLSSGRCVSPLVRHNSCVWSLAFSCEGTLLASGSADCTIKLWDVTSSTRAPRADNKSSTSNRLRSLKALPTKSTPVYTLQFSRRNLLFAAGALSKCS